MARVTRIFELFLILLYIQKSSATLSVGMYLFYFFTYLLTLITPWSRVLLEKLTGSQLVKKFHAFYGTRRFNTTFSSVCYLSHTWASSIQSIPPHPTSWRSTLILSSHLCLGLPSGLWAWLTCDQLQNEYTKQKLTWNEKRVMCITSRMLLGLEQSIKIPERVLDVVIRWHLSESVQQ